MNAPELRMVAWELTRRCNLKCLHCRASAQEVSLSDEELSTKEALELLDEIASFSKAIIILTGGEPLLRKDVLEIASHGSTVGLRMVMALNGTLLTPQVAKDLRDAGIQRISISIDGATAESHDAFRGVKGAFEAAMDGIRAAKDSCLSFQINTTVTRRNLKELPHILELAVRLGAVAHHIFMLVPTGRGRRLFSETLSAKDYEEILLWFYEQRDKVPIQLKATCAPQYYRILRQCAKREGKKITTRAFGLDASTRGCLGGIAFCFISHVGDVQPCGYLEVTCGNVRQQGLLRIWERSEVFRRLRDIEQLKGKCGRCEFRRVCGGCRARAFEATGDYMEEEPLCLYRPTLE